MLVYLDNDKVNMGGSKKPVRLLKLQNSARNRVPSPIKIKSAAFLRSIVNNNHPRD